MQKLEGNENNIENSNVWGFNCKNILLHQTLYISPQWRQNYNLESCLYLHVPKTVNPEKNKQATSPDVLLLNISNQW